MFTTWKPVVGTVTGGVPTFLYSGGRVGTGVADGSTSGFQLHVPEVGCAVGVLDVPLPLLAMNTQVTTTSSRTAADTAPMRT
jgi:hypothetical protein